MANEKRKVWYLKFRRFISSTPFVTNGLFLIGGFVILFAGFLNRVFFDRNLPTVIFDMFFAVGCAFFITSAVFIIVRKEAPRTGGFSSIKGIGAILIGIFGVILAGIAEVYFLLRILTSITR